MSEKRNEFNDISDRDLYLSMYSSQFILLIASVVILITFSSSPIRFLLSIEFHWLSGLWQGLLFALSALLINAALYQLLPRTFLDDGGLNERVFKHMGFVHIVLFCLVVAVVEEWLFRAVLQQLFGLPIASLLFALVHFRYLRKPVLFSYVLFISVALGLLYERTNNLAAVIIAHFLSNTVLALIMRYKTAKTKP